MRNFCLMFFMVLFFTGCTTSVGLFSVASTSNIPMKNVEKGDYVTGKNCLMMFLTIPLGNTQNRYSLATANALEESHKKGGPSDALINVSMSESLHGFLIWRHCVIVKGQAISVKS